MGESVPALAVIGGGAMASAILHGAAEAGVLGRVCVAEPEAERRKNFDVAVPTAAEALEWLGANESEPGSGQVMLAVKPQMLGDVAAEISPLVRKRVVISILAGLPGDRIRAQLGGSCRVVRVMPNTPAQVRKGTTAIALTAGATNADAAFADRIFHAVGDVVVRLDESMMDAFTAVAGSGPAYLFYLAEAMQQGALAVGFDTDTARTIVEQTIFGAAELLHSDDASAAELRRRVTSKKGTTQAATDTFDTLGVMHAIARGIVAARDRGIELGRD
ncbi:MAG: pyrroline-5-carboxylate reductase [Phycisphaerales bacterium]|nr:pyrroline-5-carboxylate reductase [Phycisphaerales bacterium]MCB9835689.1 pyrroline-5-carboxylate reductase [Phycisphaera sp.]